MNTLVHADIFFFVTTIAVIVFLIILCVIAWYVVLILRDMKYIASRVRHVTDELEEDFEHVRRKMGEGANRAKYIVDFFLGKFLKKRSPTHSSSRKKQHPDTTI